MLSRDVVFWEVDTQADFMLPGGKLYVPGEALTDRVLHVPNDPASPRSIAGYKQVLLEKQTLDIFESRHVEDVLQQLDPKTHFVVFGVVTEYCVRFAAKGLLDRGRKVSVVQDAIETLSRSASDETIAELQAKGASMITTGQALSLLR
jgi:nicotinamidase-related amidase